MASWPAIAAANLSMVHTPIMFWLWQKFIPGSVAPLVKLCHHDFGPVKQYVALVAV